MPAFAELKDKQRAIRDGFPPDLGLRVHRCLSWLSRAEQAEDDDAGFIFLWIAFNAAYAAEIPDTDPQPERATFDTYFRRLLDLDADHRLYDAIWTQFPHAIRCFLDNRYVFQPFWKYQNRVPGSENWAMKFDASRRRFHRALEEGDTRTILSMLFDRLYVLRNQLVHGGATWNSGVNRDQVRDGARILAVLVPAFVDLMMDNPDKDWGPPYYPVVD